MFDEIALGVTDDAVIAFFKDPKNSKIVNFIMQETYPEMAKKPKEPKPTKE